MLNGVAVIVSAWLTLERFHYHCLLCSSRPVGFLASPPFLIIFLVLLETIVTKNNRKPDEQKPLKNSGNFLKLHHQPSPRELSVLAVKTEHVAVRESR